MLCQAPRRAFAPLPTAFRHADLPVRGRRRRRQNRPIYRRHPTRVPPTLRRGHLGRYHA